MQITIGGRFQTGVSDWFQTGIGLVPDWYQTGTHPTQCVRRLGKEHRAPSKRDGGTNQKEMQRITLQPGPSHLVARPLSVIAWPRRLLLHRRLHRLIRYHGRW